MKINSLSIEPLELRISPATLVNPTTLTFQDQDGDDVIVKISKPVLTDATINAVFTFDTGGANTGNLTKQHLQVLDLTKLADITAAARANLSITAKRNPTNGGDGFVNVDSIVASGGGNAIDLGTVLVDGDLLNLSAGDTTTTTTGLKSLTVQSLGRFATGAVTVAGAVGILTVKSDVNGVAVQVTGGDDGKINVVNIAGSIIGAGAGSQGSIKTTGNIGTVKVAGSLIGGSAADTGAIVADGTIASVNVGGSLIGGSGSQSGRIRGNDGLGTVKILGSVLGGTGNSSGQVRSVSGKILNLTIGGSVLGGTQLQAGAILAGTGIVAVKVGGDLAGDAGSRSGSIFCDGAGSIGSAIIGGSIRSGAANPSGFVSCNGAIGKVTVNGSLMGSASSGAFIAAKGAATPGKTDIAMGSVTVKGSVIFGKILGGYSFDFVPLNADAQIGSVKVGGDWVASSLVAGVVDGGDGFGNGNDAAINEGSADPNILSKIATVTIKGMLLGTPSGINNADRFGFVAEQIGKLTVGGTIIPLQPAAHDDITPILLGTTGDLTVHEI
jgi:hypothetical protein